MRRRRRELLGRAADREQQGVVLERLALVGVDRVVLDVDVDDDRVEPEVDVVVVVPRFLVDRNRGLGELPLRVLLDQDPVVEGLPLVGENRDLGVRRFLAERLGRGRARDTVPDDHVRIAHVRPFGFGVNVGCHPR